MSRASKQVTTPQGRPQVEIKTRDDVPLMSREVPEIKEEDFNSWLAKLYDLNDIPDDFLTSSYALLAYQGFNRSEVLKQLAITVPDKRLALQMILVGALRGPQAGSQIKLSNGRTVIEMGIPPSGKKGTKALSLNKVISATADIAAWMMKKMNVPKRVLNDLPGWLQFPSAGSIRLPPMYRQLHIDFSKKFSELIGGAFNESIYAQMQANEYLDGNLHLFDN
jgi:hypothetical protein